MNDEISSTNDERWSSRIDAQNWSVKGSLGEEKQETNSEEHPEKTRAQEAL